jgi:hypothetical protein
MDATRHRIGYFEHGHRNLLGDVDYLLVEKGDLMIRYYDVLACIMYRCGNVVV